MGINVNTGSTTVKGNDFIVSALIMHYKETVCSSGHTVFNFMEYMMMKKIMFAVLATGMMTSSVFAMETEEETRFNTLRQLETEKDGFLKEFNKRAEVRFQNHQNPQHAAEMRDLEEQYWRHTNRILNLTLVQWPEREQALRKEQEHAWIASYAAEHPKLTYFGRGVVYCDYYSVLLGDHVWATHSNYDPHRGRWKN